MARRQWTLVIVSDDETSVRQLRLSREVIRLAIAFALFVVAGLGSLATAYLFGPTSPRADAKLAARNAALEQELSEIATKMDTLETSLEDLSKKDEYYRLLAGLEPLDEEVLQAGIGGPDADSLGASELFALDEDAGRRAFSTSSQVASLLRRARLLATSWREAGDTLSEKQSRLASTPSIFPTQGTVSSSFTSSRWHPILDRPRAHTGIDITAPAGTPVVASANGRIASVGYQGEYGLMVEIDHGHGVVTRYAHLSAAKVRAGQQVKRGEPIGNVGKSGLAIGFHLHYEVLVNGAPANPRRYILDGDVIPD